MRALSLMIVFVSVSMSIGANAAESGTCPNEAAGRVLSSVVFTPFSKGFHLSDFAYQVETPKLAKVERVDARVNMETYVGTARLTHKDGRVFHVKVQCEIESKQRDDGTRYCYDFSCDDLENPFRSLPKGPETP